MQRGSYVAHFGDVEISAKWGGAKAFNYAATGAPFRAALVFYGTAPKPEQMADHLPRVEPGIAFFGGERNLEQPQPVERHHRERHQGAREIFLVDGQPELRRVPRVLSQDEVANGTIARSLAWWSAVRAAS